MELLREMLDLQRETKDVKMLRPHLDKIAKQLFNLKTGWVIDKKRSKEPKYLGVAHQESTLVDDHGRPLKLTFDNSTDSGEFEINSLTPLLIQKGSPLDQDIKKLYDVHHVDSHKKTNYISRDGKMVMREIHLGTAPNENTVAFVKAALSLIKEKKVSRLVENQDFRFTGYLDEFMAKVKKIYPGATVEGGDIKKITSKGQEVAAFKVERTSQGGEFGHGEFAI